jgi:hypothetical protein
VALIQEFGEMWARNTESIKTVLKDSKRAHGVYILYDGSTPVYIGKGNIRYRLRRATTSNERKNFWDHFSWYVIKNEGLRHDVEALLLRTLPPYLRHLTSVGNSRTFRPRGKDGLNNVRTTLAVRRS